MIRTDHQWSVREREIFLSPHPPFFCRGVRGVDCHSHSGAEAAPGRALAGGLTVDESTVLYVLSHTTPHTNPPYKGEHIGVIRQRKESVGRAFLAGAEEVATTVDADDSAVLWWLYSLPDAPAGKRRLAKVCCE